MQRRSSVGRLAAAAGASERVLGDPETAVTGLAYDSRRVAPGDLFFCIPGTRSDGHDYASEAAGRGAAGLCVRRLVDAAVPQIVADDVRAAMALAAAEFFGRPGDALTLTGVTGTNGKTTTAFLLESILSAAGRAPGLIGTIETRGPGWSRPGVRTTPESVDLAHTLATLVAAGADSVAMEVTSHGLALKRVDGLRFAAAAFTNLTQDHLDFHSSMEDYFAAKAALFEPERCARAAVNADDPYGARLLASARVPALSFGFGDGADVLAAGVRSGPDGSEFTIVSPAGRVVASTALVGAFNVSNCLAAAATALQIGIGLDEIAAGIAAVDAVPGRFETISCGQPFSVVVDYAHTPDSLSGALRAARAVADGRVLCVFGCGGDRDKTKRPVMGRVAAALADVVVVTSDNPRSEDPEAIIAEIVAGAVAHGRRPDDIVVDRRDAIVRAVSLARSGDVVLIAGKGHETGQEFAGRIDDFDDREVARAALRTLGWGEAQ